MMKDELDPGSRGWRSRRIGTSGEAVEVGAVHLNHRLLMEEGSGGGRKERSELEQIPSVASGRGGDDGRKRTCKREGEKYFITTYLNTGEDNIADAEEHDGDGDDGGGEDTR
jgi:hypothetical protein